MADIVGGFYSPFMAAQQLQGMAMQNQMTAAQLPYAGAMAQAQLGHQQALSRLQNAEATEAENRAAEYKISQQVLSKWSQQLNPPQKGQPSQQQQGQQLQDLSGMLLKAGEEMIRNGAIVQGTAKLEEAARLESVFTRNQTAQISNSLKQLAQVAGQYRGVKSAQDLARVNAQLRAQNLTPPLQDDQYSPENVQGVISQSENAQTQAMVQLRNHAQQQSDAWKERNYGLAVAKFKIYQDRMKHLNENGGKLTAPPQGLQDVAKEAIQEQYGSDYEHSDQAAFMVAQRAWEIQRTDHISEEDAIQQAMEEQNDILQADGDLSSYDKFKQSLGMDVKPTKKFSVTKGKGKPAPKPQEASGAPKAGDIQDGYKFKGGDPANPQNWEKQ